MQLERGSITKELARKCPPDGKFPRLTFLLYSDWEKTYDFEKPSPAGRGTSVFLGRVVGGFLGAGLIVHFAIALKRHFPQLC